jgi:KUP system potassium uptake protein
VACIILAVLFALQFLGTQRVTAVFSPIVLLWFMSNMAIGLYNIFQNRVSVFQALSPHYAIMFFVDNPKTAWQSLSAVLLSFTGVRDSRHCKH